MKPKFGKEKEERKFELLSCKSIKLESTDYTL